MCKKHENKDHRFRFENDNCPYCEIDRLKTELEEAQELVARYDGIKDDLQMDKAELQNQLAEARAEVERFKHMAEQNSTEMCEWMEKANKARKEAARECMQICDNLDAEGYYYEINNHAIVKDRIAAKFGLEG